MKATTLIHKSMTRFIICMAALLLLSAPLFYLLTKNYYAEDMADLIEAVREGKAVPSDNLEEDVLHGILLQYLLIAGIIGIATVLMTSVLSKRLWKPFDRTLAAMEKFRLEKGEVPPLPRSGILEFERLNSILEKLMEESIGSYNAQKEFIENASHELQTPIAVSQGKLDILLQQPELTRRQAEIIQDLCRANSRMSRLNSSLLLLAKMENNQFSDMENLDVMEEIDELLPMLDSLTEGLTVEKDFRVESLPVKANRTLLESLLNNLFVNAVRHNRPGGSITVIADGETLRIANTSDEPALDGEMVFRRFYRSSGSAGGNGLGLAIAKSVCDHHGWTIGYSHDARLGHIFTVRFKQRIPERPSR